MFAKIQQLREEREEGFTLIELLVVILIIGILAAIAIPAFLNQRKSAVDSSAQSDVKNAATQVETAAIKAGGQSATVSVTDDGSGDGLAVITLSDPETATEITTVEAQVSEGTSLSASGNTGSGYTITATNAGGTDTGAADGTTYDSAAGGLQD